VTSILCVNTLPDEILTDEEARELNAENEVDDLIATLTSAADVHTGAMIALVPTEEDAAQLALDGGEDAEQLHLTICYLGQAALIPPEVRESLVDCVSECAARLPTITAAGFALAVINPRTGEADDGPEACVALGVSGSLLQRAHDVIAHDVYELLTQAGVNYPTPHSPWVPHVTLVYTNDADVSDLVDRVGPVTFDRVRLAFGGDNYDIPLGDYAVTAEFNPSQPRDEEVVDAPRAGKRGTLPSSPSAEEHGEMTDGVDTETLAFTDAGAPIVPNVLLDWRAFAQERDVNLPGGGPGHQLREYWVHGPGAAKIRWGTEGDGTRCIRHLNKYVKDPGGLCQEYHRMATGKSMHPHPGKTTESGEVITAATDDDDPAEPYGDVKYADPGYQSDGRKRYPIDTEEHIRAAWSYINQERNAGKYEPEQLRKIKSRIKAALREIGVDVDADASAETLTAGVGKGDCPPGTHRMPNGKCMDDDEMPSEGEDAYDGLVQPAKPRTAPWRGVLTVEGIESGDGRMFAANGLTWDEPPLPLMWQRVTSHGGNGDESVRVGTINRIYREPDPSGRANVFLIHGEGVLDLNNADGLEVYRRMLEGDMRGNSVDVDSIKGSDVQLIYPESTAGPVAAHGTGGHGEDETEDDGADKANPRVVNLFAQPELTIYRRGRIRASTMVEIPAFTEARLELTDEVLTAAAVDELMLELTSDPDQRVREQLDAITAATSTIHITDAPPREWFDEPLDVPATGALTVTAEGRVYGYLAPAGVRHRSFGDRSVTVPLRNVDYTRFHGGETIVADGGRVTTGAITMGCGHASTEYPLTSAQAKEHYDNTCSLVATARVGENKNGVWVAGALLPDVTPHQVRRMLACRLSGDWRPHLDKSGWRELTAALLVPVPGFPMARTAPSVHVEEGQLVAASVPVQFEEGPSPRERAAAIVRAVRVRQLRSHVDAFHGTHNQKSHGNRDGDPVGGSGTTRSGYKERVKKLTSDQLDQEIQHSRANAQAYEREGKTEAAKSARDEMNIAIEELNERGDNRASRRKGTSRSKSTPPAATPTEIPEFLRGVNGGVRNAAHAEEYWDFIDKMSPDDYRGLSAADKVKIDVALNNAETVDYDKTQRTRAKLVELKRKGGGGGFPISMIGPK